MAHGSGYHGCPAGPGQDVYIATMSSRAGCASPAAMDQGTYYSSGRVQQWAADNQVEHLAVPKHRQTRDTNNNLEMPHSQAMLRAGESVQGTFSVSQFDASHVSLPASNGVYQPMDYSTGLSTAGLYATSSGLNGPEVTAPYVFHGLPGLGFEDVAQDAWPTDGGLTQPASAPFEDLYANSTELPYSLGGNHDVGYDYLDSWPYGSAAPMETMNGAGEAPPMHAMTMSPLSSAAADISVSSSYSPASLLAPLSGSPISSNTQGDESCLDTNIIPDDDCVSPRFTIGEAMLATIATDYSHEPEMLSRSVPTAVSPSDSGTVTEGFCRNIRPSGSSQRPIIPSTGPGAPTHQFEELCIVPPTGDALARRSGGEAVVTPAREHELYHAVQRDDGLYHCPYEGQDNCSHKPTKLKCNYE